jgi:hypothetical protein
MDTSRSKQAIRAENPTDLYDPSRLDTYLLRHIRVFLGNFRGSDPVSAPASTRRRRLQFLKREFSRFSLVSHTARFQLTQLVPEHSWIRLRDRLTAERKKFLAWRPKKRPVVKRRRRPRLNRDLTSKVARKNSFSGIDSFSESLLVNDRRKTDEYVVPPPPPPGPPPPPPPPRPPLVDKPFTETGEFPNCHPEWLCLGPSRHCVRKIGLKDPLKSFYMELPQPTD